MSRRRIHDVTLCISMLVIGKVIGKNNKDLEQRRQDCMRPSDSPPVRKAGDLNKTFLPILNGEAFQELKPKVLSTDPWVVYFENFMSEEETSALEKHMFGPKQKFDPSPAGGDSSRQHMARHSETAFCTGNCDDNAQVQTVRKRASSITGVPTDNFDLSQALRYKEGMYYKEHHDNHPTFHYSPSGSRIFTYFVYLSDEGLEGGATYFPKLKLSAPAKRGAAVLFVNTMDGNPMRTDLRTLHESLTVTKGEKRGMNMWLYQYNYRSFWQKGCTSIELADELGRYGKAAHEVRPKVVFINNAQKATLHIFEIPDRNPRVYLGAVGPDSNFTVESADGNLLQVRNAKEGGKVIKEHEVLSNGVQRVHLGKKKSADAVGKTEL